MTRDIVSDKLRNEAMAAISLITELQSDDDVLNHDMVEGETSLFEAIDFALSEIDECDIRIVGCKEKETELAGRRGQATRRKDTIKSLIEQAMLVAEIPTIKSATATLTVRHLKPKPIIDEESDIPAEFWKQPDPVLDRKSINDAVSEGIIIPGVSKTNGTTSLTIRRK